jgi:hypothetical protein
VSGDSLAPNEHQIGGSNEFTRRSSGDSQEIAEGRDVGAIAAYRPEVDGRPLTFEASTNGIVDRQTGSVWSILGRAISGPLAGEALVPELAIDSLWFDWAPFIPETRIFGQD